MGHTSAELNLRSLGGPGLPAGGGPSVELETLTNRLRLERDALRETFDVIDDSLYLYDEAGNLQLENAAGARLRTESPSPRDSSPDVSGYVLEGNDRVGEYPLEHILVGLARLAITGQATADGGLTRAGRHFEARSYPVGGRRALVYIRDVTEDRDTGVRRLHAARRAAIGMLAAGMAHEINNPASFVVANTEALGGLLSLLDEKLRADPGLARVPEVKDVLFEARAILQESREGMARIQRVVRDLHSFSRVEDDPGGSTDVNATMDSAPSILRNELYRVRLPAVVGPAAPVLTRAPAPGRHRYRVLAIDDEPLLLKAYRRMLVEHHDIELAGSGAEALAVLQEDQRFDVILCDLQMPGISGAELYRLVSERWPGLEQRFIIITGGAFSCEARRFLEGGAVTCLNKPFHLTEILEIIERRAVSASRR
jgi:CheY-like chemotaxis protein